MYKVYVMSYIMETYEWDNTWIERTEKTSAKRVLYIGDSISCGTRTQANKLAKGEILFDGFGTSKSLDNPFYFVSLSAFTKQLPYRNAIVFNNGLHGWHLSEENYKKLYTDFLEKLIKAFPNIPIYIVLTTFVINKDFHNDRVQQRNKIAKEIAAKYRLKVIDLYSVAEENKNLLSADEVHFLDEGYVKLAEEVIKVLGEDL